MSDDRTWGVLASQSDEDALRNHITGTADEFHADVAAREIHWQHPSCGAWLAREDGNDWVGWDSRGEATGIEADCWTPWQSVLDESARPTTSGLPVVKPMPVSTLSIVICCW